MPASLPLQLSRCSTDEPRPVTQVQSSTWLAPAQSPPYTPGRHDIGRRVACALDLPRWHAKRPRLSEEPQPALPGDLWSAPAPARLDVCHVAALCLGELGDP